jgi:hypothetical protein
MTRVREPLEADSSSNRQSALTLAKIAKLRNPAGVRAPLDEEEARTLHHKFRRATEMLTEFY